jgi:hypothetical protein
MKKLLLGAACAFCLAAFPTISLAQSESGNSGPGTGGFSGNSGGAGSGTGSGGTNVNGGKNTAGSTENHGSAAITRAPSGAEFHPPVTDPGANQH